MKEVSNHHWVIKRVYGKLGNFLNAPQSPNNLIPRCFFFFLIQLRCGGSVNLHWGHKKVHGKPRNFHDFSNRGNCGAVFKYTDLFSQFLICLLCPFLLVLDLLTSLTLSSYFWFSCNFLPLLVIFLTYSLFFLFYSTILLCFLFFLSLLTYW